MSHIFQDEPRLLAVDPCPRGFGFAVLEGPKTLVDWGVKVAGGGNKNLRCLNQVASLIALYQPDVVVVEDYAGEGSRRCPRVRELIDKIGNLASGKNVMCRRYSRSDVRASFKWFGASTKHQIATAIAEKLPDLASWLPPLRKLWMPEDYRMNIFDAVSFAFAYFHFENLRRKSAWERAARKKSTVL